RGGHRRKPVDLPRSKGREPKPSLAPPDLPARPGQRGWELHGGDTAVARLSAVAEGDVGEQRSPDDRMDTISSHEHVPLHLRPVLELDGDAVLVLRKTSAALAQVERVRPDVLEEYPVQRSPVYGDGGVAVLRLDLLEVKAKEHPVLFVVDLDALQWDTTIHHG